MDDITGFKTTYNVYNSICFANICQKFVDDYILVAEEEIKNAIIKRTILLVNGLDIARQPYTDWAFLGNDARGVRLDVLAETRVDLRFFVVAKNNKGNNNYKRQHNADGN